MASWYTAYRWGSCAVLAMGFVPWIGYSLSNTHSRIHLRDRLGRYPLRHSRSHEPLVWIHGASMGEMAVAESIVSALQRISPNVRVVLSAMTPHGLRHGSDRMPPEVSLIQAPFDVVSFVGSALDRIRPDLMVFLETELWPNWIVETSKRHIPIALVNGRISTRSIGRYHKIRPLMTEILPHIDWFSMIHAADAERMVALGAPESRVVVNGNAKFDRLGERAVPLDTSTVRSRYGIPGSTPVLLAGSLRGFEPTVLMNTFLRLRNRIPDLRFIIAPRHLRRIPQILSAFQKHRIAYIRKTDVDRRPPDGTRPWDALVIDTMGDLFEAYAAADVVFCGGSLAPTGGQNVMEPAAWAKPVLYGPHMEDFIDAKELLEQTGGGLEVVDEHALYYHALRLLTFPDAARDMGRLARSALEKHRGASERHAAGLMRLLRQPEKASSVGAGTMDS